MQKTSNDKVPQTEPVNIILQFEGKDAARFVAYKNRAYITANAQAARKLILDRLDELDKKKVA